MGALTKICDQCGRLSREARANRLGLARGERAEEASHTLLDVRGDRRRMGRGCTIARSTQAEAQCRRVRSSRGKDALAHGRAVERRRDEAEPLTRPAAEGASGRKPRETHQHRGRRGPTGPARSPGARRRRGRAGGGRSLLGKRKIDLKVGARRLRRRRRQFGEAVPMARLIEEAPEDANQVVEAVQVPRISLCVAQRVSVRKVDNGIACGAQGVPPSPAAPCTCRSCCCCCCCCWATRAPLRRHQIEIRTVAKRRRAASAELLPPAPAPARPVSAQRYLRRPLQRSPLNPRSMAAEQAPMSRRLQRALPQRLPMRIGFERAVRPAL